MNLSSVLFTGGRLLRAADAGPDSRIREGILVPWNEDGRTNLGRGFPVRPQFAAALAPDAKVVGIYGHNREQAVSRLITHATTPAGLWGRIYVNATALGDQLLAEIDGGARDGLSIEASDLVLDEAGGIVAGSLDFFAHVPVGAYDSARVSALAASVPSTPGDFTVTLPAQPAQPAAPAPAGPVLQATVPGPPAFVQPATGPAPAAPVYAQPAPAAPAPAAAPAPDLAQLLAALQPAAPAPAPAPVPTPAPGVLELLAGLAQLQASAHVAPVTPSIQSLAAAGLPSAAALLPGAPQAPQAQAPQAPQVLTDPLREVAQLSAQLYNRPGDAQLRAALEDITATGLPLFQESSSRLGDRLWEGTADTSRPFVDLMAQGPLESMRYYGWEWTQLPEMEEWDGDKTEINGNPVDLRQVPFDAKRCAAGWDVDRKYRDFGDPVFWSEFYVEQTRAYRRLSNTWAAQALVAAALDVTVAANYSDAGTPGPLPADAKTLVPSTGVPEGVTQIIRAAMIARVILENTPRVEQGQDYVLVNAYDWLRLADLTTLDLPAFLALLKVDPSRFIPTTKIPRNRVIAGVIPSMKYRELPGTEGKGSPIRVEALDIGRGGVDSAVFGYVGISRERPGGVLSIPLDDPDGALG